MRLVAGQLRCAGLVSAVRISRAAYPSKLNHDAFLQRYSILLLSLNKRDKQMLASMTQQMPGAVAGKASENSHTRRHTAATFANAASIFLLVQAAKEAFLQVFVFLL